MRQPLSILIILNIIFIVILVSFMACSQSNQTIAIRGGTLIDLSNKGTSENDVKDVIILIQEDKIISVGNSNDVQIPGGTRIIDATGQYIIPGLIDGFAALNNQAYANAYLYRGVTSIIAVSGGRRGDLFEYGDPGPAIYRLSDVGYEKCDDSDLLKKIEQKAAEGVKVLLLMYKLPPQQLKLAVQKAHSLGMGTIGELGYSSYAAGIDAGIDVFVHSTRYSLDIAPDGMRGAVAEHPFSDDLRSAKWRYYTYLTGIDGKDEKVLQHAKRLGSARTYLMPTLSLLYLNLPGHQNPWSEPIARILDPEDINNPADKTTGDHDYDDAHLQAYTQLGMNVLKIEQSYRQAGARYLAGSATDVWGTMPGISLHVELKLLHHIGLSNRQALAAATSNFALAFHWNHTGQIKSGCVADILILDKNPLEDLENLKRINRLFLRGREINRQKLLDYYPCGSN